MTTIEKSGGSIESEQLASIQGNASEKLASIQGNASEKLASIQGNASEKLASIQGQVNSLLPEMSVNGVLKKVFGLNDEQLSALGKADPSILQKAFWQSLNEKKWALITSALGFIPFIGQDFLAAKSVYKEATEVLSESTKKIEAMLPKISSEGVEMQQLSASPTTVVPKGGSRARNSNAILRRIEKSKKAFHNTNKSNATFGKSNATFGKSNATFGKSNATFGKSKKPRKTRRRMKQTRK
jgi:hypothetical protein